MPSFTKATSTLVRARMPRLRSKSGCVLCRLRKRKCDEKKPSCDYCQERGVDCVWLTRTSPQEIQQKLERLKAQSKRYDLELYAADSPASQDRIPVCLISDPSNVSISFLLANLFTGANTPCSGPGSHPLTIYTELFFADDPNSLTWGVLDAMATVFWGMRQHDNEVTLRGLQARGTCLTRLGCALSQDPASFSGDLVAAVALARSFEQLLPHADRTWIRHALGMGRIFDAMGPEAFESPAMLRLLENNRWPAIMAASTVRQSSLLNTEEWRTIPWQRIGRKDILQRLLDVYSMVPDVHVLWDKGMRISDQTRSCSARDDFVSRLHDVLLKMQHWRQSSNLEIADSVQPWEDVIDTTPCPWQTAVSFTKIHHAYAIALYNMIVIVLVSYLTQIDDFEAIVVCHGLDPLHQLLGASPLPWNNLKKVLVSAADEVAMVIPWLMQDHLKGAGTLYLSGPTLISKLFWEKSEPMKSAWFEQMIQEMRSRWSSVLATDGLIFAKG